MFFFFELGLLCEAFWLIEYEGGDIVSIWGLGF